MPVNILDFKDGDGKRFVFSKDNFEKHKNHHVELRDDNFVNNVIKKAVCEPTFIYPAFKQKKRFCFYLYEYSLGTFKWYAKVIVDKRKWLYIIVTAFRLDKVKEECYFSKPLCKRP